MLHLVVATWFTRDRRGCSPDTDASHAYGSLVMWMKSVSPTGHCISFRECLVTNPCRGKVAGRSWSKSGRWCVSGLRDSACDWWWEATPTADGEVSREQSCRWCGSVFDRISSDRYWAPERGSPYTKKYLGGEGEDLGVVEGRRRRRRGRDMVRRVRKEGILEEEGGVPGAGVGRELEPKKKGRRGRGGGMSGGGVF